MIRVRSVLSLALGTGTSVVGLFLPSAAVAQNESRLSADASVTAGYQNNPFTIQGGDTGSGLVTIDLAPRYQLLTERSTFTVSADADLQQYFRRYGHNENYSGTLDYQGRPSERLTTHARLDLSSAVLGASGGYLPTAPTSLTGIGATGTGAAATGTGAAVPVVAVDPLVPITDIGLFGLRNRRRTVRLSGDASYSVSARDTLTLSAYGEATRYHDLPAGNYQAYGGSAGYSRRLSDRLTLGLQGSAAAYDYHLGIANTRVYSVQATASGRLNGRWTADGALGVSFVSSDTALSTRSTSLSGNVDLCRRGPLTTLCLQAARQVLPTGLAGSQYVTSAGANWNRQLSEHDSVFLGGSYSKVNGATLLVPGLLPLQTEYAQANVGYSRQLRERLRLIASANYRQILGSGDAGRPKDFGGQVGLSYRIGDKR